MARRHAKIAASLLAAVALVGAVAAARRGVQKRPAEPERSATAHATVLRTQVTPLGNRVDVEGATLWTPRDAYFMAGQTIPIVYDEQGSAHWDAPRAYSRAPYLLLCILCVAFFFFAAMLAAGK